MCVHASRHIYIHTYIHTHPSLPPSIHPSIHPCIHGCLQVCIHVCMYVCMYVCMGACMHEWICAYVHQNVCMHACMHAWMHVGSYKHTFANMNMPRGTNACACSYTYALHPLQKAPDLRQQIQSVLCQGQLFFSRTVMNCASVASARNVGDLPPQENWWRSLSASRDLRLVPAD